MNSKNSWTSHSHILLLNIREKINLKRNDNYVGLPNLSISYTWKNTKKSYEKNKLVKIIISVPTWNGEFELPDGSYSIPDIQDYIEYILKNTEKRLIILQ